MIARIALGVLLLAMAAGQLASAAEFVDSMATYQIGGRAPATLLAGLLVASELAGGLGLLSSRPAHRRVAAVIALGVAVAWSVLAVQAFARRLTVDNCGCFGAYLSQRLRWWVLIEDAEFVALALWVRRSVRKPGDVTTETRPVRIQEVVTQ